MRFTEFKKTTSATILESIVNEVKMSPIALQKFLNSELGQSAVAGFEAEIDFPRRDFSDPEDYEYPEKDDEVFESYNQAVEFFYNEGYGESRNYVENKISEWMIDEVEETKKEVLTDDFIKYSSSLARELYDQLEHFIEMKIDEDYIPDEFKDEDGNVELSKELTEYFIDNDTDTVLKYFLDTTEDFPDTDDEVRDESYDLITDGRYEMSDISRQTGLNWPVDYDAQPPVGENGYDELMNEFIDETDGFGYQVISHSNNDDYGVWNFVSDGSLSESSGVEIVSPAMPLVDIINVIPQFFDWVKSSGGEATGETGFHMSVSFPNYSLDNLNYVKFALFLGDIHVLQQFQRLANGFAMPAFKRIAERMNKYKKQNVENAMRGLIDGFDSVNAAMNDAASKIINSAIVDKYTSIHPKKNYVEIRSAGNENYFNNTEKLQNSLLRYAYALSIALDPEAENKEFAKKLYKFMSGFKFSDNDGVDLLKIFALHASGNLSGGKEAMKAIIKNKPDDSFDHVRTPGFNVVIDNPYVKEMHSVDSHSMPIVYDIMADATKNDHQFAISQIRQDILNRMKKLPREHIPQVHDHRTGRAVPFNPMDSRHLPAKDIKYELIKAF